LRPGRMVNPASAWDGVELNAPPESGRTSGTTSEIRESESGRITPQAHLADWSDVSTATSRNAQGLQDKDPLSPIMSPGVRNSTRTAAKPRIF
jgi:hypothetical protein